MAKISKGDYLIYKENNKHHLVKALADNDSKTVELVDEKNCHLQGMRNTFTGDLKQIILNLGPEPHPGKVYGHDVATLFRKRLDHPDFGNVHFFYRPAKEVLVDLRTSMDAAAKKLKKTGLEFLLDCEFEVLPFNGEKYAGRFLMSKKEDVPKRIQIRPEIMPASEYQYVWHHELGHNLHLAYCKEARKLNAQWLKYYNTSIKIETIKKDKSQQLLDLLMDGEERPSDFKRGLDEEDTLAFNWIMRSIKQVSALSIKELDLLFEAEEKDEIKAVWPIRGIPHKELSPVITEYATVHYQELVAEAFGLYMVGKKLPERAVKLVEKTIAYAKANREK